MLKVLGAVFGFLLGFSGLAMLFAVLATQYRIDLFHWYIIDPTPPPGGYRTPLDVPPASWPFLVFWGFGALLGKAGVSLGKKAEQRLRNKTHRKSPGDSSTHVERRNNFFEAQCPKCSLVMAVFDNDPNQLTCYECGAPLVVERSGNGGVLKAINSTPDSAPSL